MPDVLIVSGSIILLISVRGGRTQNMVFREENGKPYDSAIHSLLYDKLDYTGAAPRAPSA